MIRIKITAFTDLRTAEFGAKAQEIINLMTGNPAFPTPSPALASVQTVVDNYIDYMLQAETGDRLKIAQRNTQRDVLTAQLVDLAGYVAYTVRNAPNAKDLIESAGFVAAKTAGHVGELAIPQALASAVMQTPGGIALKWKSVYGANSYVVEMTAGSDTPTSTWDEIATLTKTKYNVMGLTPGQFYSFRVRAVGAAGYSEPSDVTTCVVG